MKRLSSIVALAALAVGWPGGARAQGADTAVLVNGEQVRFTDIGPIERNGRLLVPWRDVLMRLNAAVAWDPRTRTVTASRTDQEVRLKIGSRRAWVNDRAVWLDTPPVTVAGRTMVPLRFVAHSLRADVRWDVSANRVVIDTRPTSGVTTAGLESDGARRNPPLRPAPDYERALRASEATRDSALESDYARFLVVQDFQRYLNDRAAWLRAYQDYQQDQPSFRAGAAGENYMRFLRAQDRNLYTDNRFRWRQNYAEFLRWRRLADSTGHHPRFDDYQRDMRALVEQTRQLPR